MRLLTFWSPTTETAYCSTRARQPGDWAIADRPQDMPDAAFNPESGEWEPVYERGDETTDITIGEAEALWQAAQDGNAVASVVLKLADL